MFGKEKYSVVLLSVITTKSFPEKNNSSGPYLAGHNEKVTQIIFLFGRLVHQSKKKRNIPILLRREDW